MLINIKFKNSLDECLMCGYIQIMWELLICISETGIKVVAGLSGVILAAIILIAVIIRSKKKG